MPDGGNYYREAYPYGPDGSGGFHASLAVEVDPAQVNPYARALAVVGGVVRFIPDATPATGALILKPDASASADLAVPLDGGTVVFVYRNLDTAAVRTVMLPIIQALGDAPFASSGTADDRANAFVTGEFGLPVRGGDEVGTASTSGGADGWARLGFEIVYVPGGLDPGTALASSATGWDRLHELTDPGALTRRLDPASFYAAVAVGAGPATIDPGDAGSPLFVALSRRTLIELRDEYDEPLTDSVTIQGPAAGPVTQAPAAGARGTFVVDSTSPGSSGPANSIEYSVTVPNKVMTKVPFGAAAAAVPTRTMAAPAHWALQAILMALDLSDADEPKSWFAPNVPPFPRYTEHNVVTPIRDGVEVFRRYTDAFRSVTAADQFAYINGWRMIDSFPLVDPDATTTVAALTQAIASAGAEVRALLWDQPLTANTDEVKHINALPGGHGQAILDNWTLNLGAHHQKLLVINGGDGAFAFCGGVDINTDRRDSPSHGAVGAFHDVHARVDGPAVADLHGVFIERWNNHPSHPTALPTAPPPFAASPGSVYVQVARTYPPQMHYPFAPSGSLVPLNAFIRAIGRARKFIYIEDQYLTPYPGRDPAGGGGDTVGILTALRAALPNIDYLIIVIPNHTDQPQGRFRRQQFIEGLRAVDASKVRVFFLGRDGPHPGTGEVATEGGCDSCSGGQAHRDEIYVHAKVWIVDDVVAKIGSCNINRRGYTHDSELDLVMVDGAVDNGGRALAKRLRLALWGEHLNMTGSAALEDHKLALSFWQTPPAGARIRLYDHNAEIDLVNTDTMWNNAYDPDGR